jgi:hypothetical protein
MPGTPDEVQVITEDLDPPGRRFWVEDDMLPIQDGKPYPHYTVHEFAKVFLGKGPEWVRWRHRPTADNPDGKFILDGVPLVIKRTDSDNRYYTLADVERMGHALAQQGEIDGSQLLMMLMLVKWEARLYGVIE